MKENIQEWMYNTGLMSAGLYARHIFGGEKFNWKQTIAMVLFGIGIVAIVNQLNIQSVYKLSFVMVSGLVLPNLIRMIIKGSNDGQDKATKNIVNKIDKYTK